MAQRVSHIMSVSHPSSYSTYTTNTMAIIGFPSQTDYKIMGRISNLVLARFQFQDTAAGEKFLNL